MNRINKNNLKISIALATYNGARYLSHLLESIEQQTLLPSEVIVCDDCSSDETLAVLNQFRERLPLQIISNEKSLGVVANFQKAVSLCSGDYIAFCDQDDVWLPHKLRLSVDELIKADGGGPAMVFTDLRVVDESLNLVADSYWQHRRLKPQKETFTSLLYGNIVTGCTMVVNRAMAEEIARMPANVLMHDFWIACVAYGVGTHAFIDTPTLLYRQHATNVTNNDAITWQTRLNRNLQFLLEGQQAKLFLMPEISQAQMFFDLYKDRLADNKRQSLQKLFSLEARPPVFRKWKTFLIKFLHVGINN